MSKSQTNTNKHQHDKNELKGPKPPLKHLFDVNFQFLIWPIMPHLPTWRGRTA